jgi:hypothetical protein
MMRTAVVAAMEARRKNRMIVFAFCSVTRRTPIGSRGFASPVHTGFAVSEKGDAVMTTSAPLLAGSILAAVHATYSPQYGATFAEPGGRDQTGRPDACVVC